MVTGVQTCALPISKVRCVWHEKRLECGELEFARNSVTMSSEKAESASDSFEIDSFEGPSTARIVLDAEAAQPARESELTEDLVLAYLNQRDLPAEAVEQVARNAAATKSRKVRRALAAHPHAPRHVSLKLLREFYTFDLMQFALTPGPAADLKRAADELLVTRLTSITLGERLSLARRGSGNVAAALLLDKESRVWQTALENSRLTEAALVRVLARSTAGAALVEAVSHHTKWSLRKEIRVALLRNPKTPASRALEFARALPPAQLRDVLHSSRLPEKVKDYLRKSLEARRA